MLGFLKLAAIGIVVLTVVYICLSFYSRAVRREKLEAEWEEHGMTVDKEIYVDEGLKTYDSSLKRKLILGVYIVPITLVSALIYFTNFH